MVYLLYYRNSLFFFHCLYIMELCEFINVIFSDTPKSPCSFHITHSNCINAKTKDQNAIIMFPVLMNILILGARKIFGENINPAFISEKDFNLLKEYILSIGYILKSNQVSDENGIKKINIWFEQFNPTVTCHGLVIY